jgi:hypothetical protein
VAVSHFQSVGFQEYHPNATTVELGRALRLHLIKAYGPCWVTERIWELAVELNQIPVKHLLDLGKRFEGTSVNPDDFEEMVLGKMVEATFKSAEQLKSGDGQGIKALAEPEKLFAKPFASAMAAFTKEAGLQMKIDNEVVRGFKPAG